jgi:hypothetical protein
MRKPKTVRCAIYTRKSSDEGLEQSFNSLDAQREAGEAYVKSQAHEGWTAIPTLYDDGGYSGGSMERPPSSACSPTSMPGWWMSWWSTRSTGGPARFRTSPASSRSSMHRR